MNTHHVAHLHHCDVSSPVGLEKHLAVGWVGMSGAKERASENPQEFLSRGAVRVYASDKFITIAQKFRSRGSLGVSSACGLFSILRTMSYVIFKPLIVTVASAVCLSNSSDELVNPLLRLINRNVARQKKRCGINTFCGAYDFILVPADDEPLGYCRARTDCRQVYRRGLPAPSLRGRH